MAVNEIKEQFLDIIEENIGIIIKMSRVYAKVTQDRDQSRIKCNFTDNSVSSIITVRYSVSLNY